MSVEMTNKANWAGGPPLGISDCRWWIRGSGGVECQTNPIGRDERSVGMARPTGWSAKRRGTGRGPCRRGRGGNDKQSQLGGTGGRRARPALRDGRRNAGELAGGPVTGEGGPGMTNKANLRRGRIDAMFLSERELCGFWRIVRLKKQTQWAGAVGNSGTPVAPNKANSRAQWPRAEHPLCETNPICGGCAWEHASRVCHWGFGRGRKGVW